MAASARFPSTLAFAFVAGVTTTGVYMSQGGVRREAAVAEAVRPSLVQRLRAEAHGESLPWSDPVKTKLEPPKLTFTPGPADAPAKEGGAVADEGRAPGPQATPVPAPAQPPANGRSRVRLAQSDRQTPPPEEDQPEPAPAIKRARPSEKDVGPSRAKMVEASGLPRTSRDDSARTHIKLAQSSRPTSQPDGEAGHPADMSAEAARHVPPPVEVKRLSVRVADATPRARPSDADVRRLLAKAAEGTRQGRPPEHGDERQRVRAAAAPKRVRPSEEDDSTRTGIAEALPRVHLTEADQERPGRRAAEPARRLPIHNPGDDGYPRIRAAEEQRPVQRSRPLPSRSLPSLAAADDIRAAVRRAEARRERVTVAPSYRTAGLEDREDNPSAREVPVVRRDEELDDEPRVRVRRSVAASDGLMRWLSGPDSRF
jgi:hypothetical protein